MPAKSPAQADSVTLRLAALGARIRDHRKLLRVSATATAQAAGLSRVTLHRIEAGEPSVTIGAYLNVLAALGLEVGVEPAADLVPPTLAVDAASAAPSTIRLAEYPQLKRLAWQIHGIDELTSAEALGLYERNWRHIDLAAMPPRERALVEALRRAHREALTGV
jgi:transcriptional regulator with XRE-family HTH domain